MESEEARGNDVIKGPDRATLLAQGIGQRVTEGNASRMHVSF